MDAQQLFKAGKLTEAISALNAQLRDNPADLKGRTFLFELLCFAGEYDRADKQLGIIEQEGKQESMHGHSDVQSRPRMPNERGRKCLRAKTYPKKVVNGATSAPIKGKLNGKEFQSLSDADPRIGEKLEVFAGRDYLWISYNDIASIKIEPPKRLRDLLWSPARLLTGPAFRSRDLGDILLPAISPLSWQNPDDEVRLGRVSEWFEDEAGEISPFGQKNLLIDGEEIPFLEVRELEIYPAQETQPLSE